MTEFSPGNRRASKLSIPEVIEIRELYRRGQTTQGALSRRFGVSIVQIGRIIRGEVWQHIPSFEAVLSEGELKESALRLLKIQEQLGQSGTQRLQKVAAETFGETNKILDEIKGKGPLDE